MSAIRGISSVAIGGKADIPRSPEVYRSDAIDPKPTFGWLGLGVPMILKEPSASVSVLHLAKQSREKLVVYESSASSAIWSTGCNHKR